MVENGLHGGQPMLKQSKICLTIIAIVALIFIPMGCGGPTTAPEIAFVSDRDGDGEIYVMGADGSNQTRLTNNPATDWTPSWSPDGSKIALESDRDGNFEIYVMDADGSNQTRLTNNPATDWMPSWSP